MNLQQLPVLFIDRSLGGRVLAEFLRERGIACEAHDDHCVQNAPDQEWLRLVGRKSWVALGRDQHIRRRRAEKQALLDAGARLIIVRMKGAKTPKIARVLWEHIHRIEQFIRKNKAPFIAGLDEEGNIRLYPL